MEYIETCKFRTSALNNLKDPMENNKYIHSLVFSLIPHFFDSKLLKEFYWRFVLSHYRFKVWNVIFCISNMKFSRSTSYIINKNKETWISFWGNFTTAFNMSIFFLRIRTISTSWILAISNLLKFYFLSSQKFLLIQIQVNMKPKNGSHVLKVVELFHQHHSNFLLHELGKLETYKFMFHDNWMTTYFCFSRYFRINFFLERAPWTSILWCRSIYCVCEKFTFLLMLLFTLFIEFWHNTKKKFDK